jgi:hypothetical protein
MGNGWAFIRPIKRLWRFVAISRMRIVPSCRLCSPLVFDMGTGNACRFRLLAFR